MANKSMFTHEPANYVCPFCTVIKGADNPPPYTTQQDVIYRTPHITAFINVRW